MKKVFLTALLAASIFGCRKELSSTCVTTCNPPGIYLNVKETYAAHEAFSFTWTSCLSDTLTVEIEAINEETRALWVIALEVKIPDHVLSKYRLSAV
jgi:hypothetical protein